MQKVVNVLLSLFIIGLVFGCGSSYEKTPVNITAEPDGKTTWTSSFGVGTVKIHRAFTYVGVEDRSDAKVRRFYHVWKKETGEIIFIIDFSSKTTWTFPEDFDPGLGRQQSPQEKGIVAHKSMEYTVWTGVYKPFHSVMENMELKAPECKFAIQTGRFSPSRKSAYFFLLLEKRPCESDDISRIMDDAREWVTLM